jgi:hypothetical protein
VTKARQFVACSGRDAPKGVFACRVATEQLAAGGATIGGQAGSNISVAGQWVAVVTLSLFWRSSLGISFHQPKVDGRVVAGFSRGFGPVTIKTRLSR